MRKVDELVKYPSLKFFAGELGMNRHVVMTIQSAEGRVYAVKFISAAKDNRLRKRYLEKVVNLQVQAGVIPEGERFAKRLWDKIADLDSDVAHRVSREIVNFAGTHGTGIIVFERMDSLNPAMGTKLYRNKKSIF